MPSGEPKDHESTLRMTGLVDFFTPSKPWEKNNLYPLLFALPAQRETDGRALLGPAPP